MTILSQSGIFFSFSIFKGTANGLLTKKEILEIISKAEKATGKVVRLKFKNVDVQRAFLA